jgi:hypothetical protein
MGNYFYIRFKVKRLVFDFKNRALGLHENLPAFVIPFRFRTLSLQIAIALDSSFFDLLVFVLLVFDLFDRALSTRFMQRHNLSARTRSALLFMVVRLAP